MKFRTSIISFVFTAVAVFPQNTQTNYNDYYRFPFSLGVEYQSMQPVQSYDEEYTIMDFSADFRIPLPEQPTLQPFLKLGLTNLDSRDISYPEKWDHYHLYSHLGLGYTNRFAKNFEVGADFQSGVSQAVFPDAVDTGPVGALYWQVEGAAKISLDPSYSYSIDIRPSLRYQKSLQPLDKFDGFLAGLGFAVNFRFGEDPDSAAALMRFLRFDEIQVDPVFSAMQSYYVRNPIGSAQITNTGRSTLTDLQVSFMQAGFMDSPTIAARFPELKPGETLAVDFPAAYNSQVFTINGVTPLTGEVIVSYTVRGRHGEQKESVTYDLHDKTAVTWDDDRKTGAFITPADSALQNYVSFIRKAAADEVISYWSQSVQTAVQVYGALKEIGMIYQIDPVSPFTQAQKDALVVDSIKLPRDTLSRGTGDCDDLTVLYCSLLEAAGIETGFITVPGHIFPAVNTGYRGRQFGELHPDRRMTIDVDGELWLPVEITMVAAGQFLDAWYRGADLWHNFDETPESRGFYRTRTSQTVYRPVGLRESDLGLQYGDPQALASVFRTSLADIGKIVTEGYSRTARESGREQDYNRAGMIYAKFGFYREAESYLEKALHISPDYVPALINRGNIAYMRENFSRALEDYRIAYDNLSSRGLESSSVAARLLINMSKTSYAAGEHNQAQTLYVQAQELEPQLASSFAYLGSAGGFSRASDLSESENIFFIEE